MEKTKKGNLVGYSVLSRKPEWLLRLKLDVSCRFGGVVEDTPAFWQALERFIKNFFYYHQGTQRFIALIKSDIDTRIKEDEGVTVLDVLRNGRPVLTYKIK
ncbi:hypothetical protein [Prevotella falsenii]|uniref:hypothetical protein n=1 Tax=Prevotella falsenii TaxID=515414 RepID=UPI000468A485|nr:hypothetical protein [Prevotella falsenii]